LGPPDKGAATLGKVLAWRLAAGQRRRAEMSGLRLTIATVLRVVLWVALACACLMRVDFESGLILLLMSPLLIAVALIFRWAKKYGPNTLMR
jgi:hypothetical protein